MDIDFTKPIKVEITVPLKDDGTIDYSDDGLKHILPFTPEELKLILSGKSIEREYNWGNPNPRWKGSYGSSA